MYLNKIAIQSLIVSTGGAGAKQKKESIPRCGEPVTTRTRRRRRHRLP